MLLLFHLLILLASFSIVAGLPYFIVDSGRPKCVLAEVAEDAFVKIIYDAPDISTNPDADDHASTFITVLEKMAPQVNEVVREQEGKHPHKVRDRKQQGGAKNFELTETKGVFHYQAHHDGQMNVCIRASKAGSANPMRFGLRVEESGDNDDEFAEAHPPLANVDRHLSDFERQLKRLKSGMRGMILEAEYAQERDALYHSKTDAMLKAITFWPVLHVGILVVTGFTQANHIVQFFKKRRIL